MKHLWHFFFVVALFLCAATGCKSDRPVTVSETDELFILDNGIVRAKVAKASGDLVSLVYKDSIELLATFLTPEGEPDLQKDTPGQNLVGLNRGMTDHQYGFWSHDAMGIRDSEHKTITKITLNNGNVAEISIKGISKDRLMGTGPGVRAGTAQFAADIEIRFALQRGKAGVYTYCIFDHPADYPYTSLGEARFCAKLNEYFDWMSVDADTIYRNAYYPKTLNRGDKYVYTANLHNNRAFGWSSTTRNIGLFFINTSMEYMSGGPTKVEFMGHRDTNPVAAPCVLNYWRSSHYGGAEVNVAAGEHWTKMIGPFLIYITEGTDPQDIYKKAKAQVPVEEALWPYTWVQSEAYPLSADRVAVKGKLTLNDTEIASPFTFTKLTVGLVPPPYVSPRAPIAPPAPDAQPQRPPQPPQGASAQQTQRPPMPPPPVIPPFTPFIDLPATPIPNSENPMVDWQRDAKFYQFWTTGNADGSFEIKHVRAGVYSFYAFADGVPGVFIAENVTVKAGQPLDLGELVWKPVRYGKLLWEIGIPNRSSSEFYYYERHNDPETPLKYGLMFPNDITYTIGQSNFSKDWFCMHVPHNTDPEARSSGMSGATAIGNATPWNVVFNMAAAPTSGKVTLRFAIAGSGASELGISVNGEAIGRQRLRSESAIARHGSHGIWTEYLFSFDAAKLKGGTNTLTLTIPAGQCNNGVLYDYISLELAQ